MEAAPEAGLSCTPDTGASACEKCALKKCCKEANACESDKTGCYDTLDDAGGNPLDTFYSCVSSDSGTSGVDCGMAFATNASSGAGKANDLITCLASGPDNDDGGIGDCSAECGL
jgi:hypothetical protein